jgi:hypothetical protein
VGDGNIAGEIPLLSSFLYLLGEAERVRRSLTSGGCHGVLEPSAQSGVPGVAAGVVPCPYVACGGQAFIATSLFDPSMSALPIIAKQNSPSVGLFTR